MTVTEGSRAPGSANLKAGHLDKSLAACGSLRSRCGSLLPRHAKEEQMDEQERQLKLQAGKEAVRLHTFVGSLGHSTAVLERTSVSCITSRTWII